MFKSLDLNPWPCHFLAGWPWVNYLTSLHLRFFRNIGLSYLPHKDKGQLHIKQFACSCHTVCTHQLAMTVVCIVPSAPEECGFLRSPGSDHAAAHLGGASRLAAGGLLSCHAGPFAATWPQPGHPPEALPTGRHGKGNTPGICSRLSCSLPWGRLFLL